MRRLRKSGEFLLHSKSHQSRAGVADPRQKGDRAMEMNQYKLSILTQAVTEYFEAESEYRKFLKTRKPNFWESKTAQERAEYTRHLGRTESAWNTLIMMCKLVTVNIDALIPIVKAINRWEKNHGKYDRHLDWNFLRYSQDKNFRKNITSYEEFFDDKHYLSTGREIKA